MTALVMAVCDTSREGSTPMRTKSCMERIFRSHEPAKGGRHPPCTAMGVKLESCLRTTAQDIDYLQNRPNAPKRQTVSHPVFQLPPMPRFPAATLGRYGHEGAGKH